MIYIQSPIRKGATQWLEKIPHIEELIKYLSLGTYATELNGPGIIFRGNLGKSKLGLNRWNKKHDY